MDPPVGGSQGKLFKLLGKVEHVAFIALDAVWIVAVG